MKNILSQWHLYIPSAVTLIILSLFFGQLPGLHGDEAYLIIKSKDLIAGIGWLDGMNSYSGSTLFWIALVFFKIFGYKPIVIKLLGVIFSVLNVALAAKCFEYLTKDKKISLIFGLLLATFPIFALYGRYSMEIFTLCLTLTLCGFIFFIKAYSERDSKKIIIYSLLCGLFLGFNVYNHPITATIPLSLFILFLAIKPIKTIVSPIFRFGIIGLLLGFSPRFLSMYLYPPEFKSNFMLKVTDTLASQNILEILTSPHILWKMADSSLVYLRFVGDIIVPVIPYLTLAFVLIFSLRLITRKISFRKEAYILALMALQIVLVHILSEKAANMRFFYTTALFVPALFALLIHPLTQLSKKYTKFCYSLVGFIVICNVFYISTNFFYGYLKTNGNVHVFDTGNGFMETSNHFVSKKSLYKYLLDKKFKYIYSESTITMPLLAIDYNDKKLDLRTQPVLPDWVSFAKHKVHFILYNGRNNVYASQLNRDNSKIFHFDGKNINYEFVDEVDGHFRIFKAVFPKHDRRRL